MSGALVVPGYNFVLPEGDLSNAIPTGGRAFPLHQPPPKRMTEEERELQKLRDMNSQAGFIFTFPMPEHLAPNPRQRAALTRRSQEIGETITARSTQLRQERQRPSATRSSTQPTECLEEILQPASTLQRKRPTGKQRVPNSAVRTSTVILQSPEPERQERAAPQHTTPREPAREQTLTHFEAPDNISELLQEIHDRESTIRRATRTGPHRQQNTRERVNNVQLELDDGSPVTPPETPTRPSLPPTVPVVTQPPSPPQVTESPVPVRRAAPQARPFAPFATLADTATPTLRTGLRVRAQQQARANPVGGANNRGGEWEIADFSYENLLELGTMAVCVGLTKQQISRLPTAPFLPDKTPQAECSVCLEAFSIGESVMQLACKHCFHTPCITQWLLKNNKCPCCRYQVARIKEAIGR
eukprot:TRINITY_DN4355_c0_g1_i1.p1 TRINITY_DN4355_c0_g1~~TRINITY_DN4355_c0_g1_i1.p1  ORF type:complete len:425 (-),score=46.80 TRINITY_DN4355_c0_g1_i1:27-1271(-)